MWHNSTPVCWCRGLPSESRSQWGRLDRTRMPPCSASGIPTLPIRMAKMVYTSIYEYIRAYTMPYDIIPYPRLSIRYEPIWIISDHIGGIYHRYGFCRKHKRVYTRFGDIPVYDGIWLFITVYDGIWCSRKVYTSIYHHELCIWLFVDGISRYIPVFTCL